MGRLGRHLPGRHLLRVRAALNYVGGDGTGEWAYHGTADLGAGSVTVVPTQATDYYVLLLGGADGYTELTDPDNRHMVTVIAASEPSEPSDPTTCPTAGYSTLSGPGFVDISPTGTLITDWEQNADDGWFEVALPFTFPYYGLNEQVHAHRHERLHHLRRWPLRLRQLGALPGQRERTCGRRDWLRTGLTSTRQPPTPKERACTTRASAPTRLSFCSTRLCTGPVTTTPPPTPSRLILFSTGGFLLAYPEMNDPTGTCRGPPSPIGYENQDGSDGVQISYDEVPASGTQYYIPPACTAPGGGEGSALDPRRGPRRCFRRRRADDNHLH